MMRRACFAALLAAGVWAAAPGDAVLAQQPPAKKGQRTYYDQYEPNRVLRGRLQTCLRGEEEIGAYCVRACRKGYLMVPDRHPPRCRGIEPLPPGQLPGPLRRDIGVQPKAPDQPAKPPPPPGGA